LELLFLEVGIIKPLHHIPYSIFWWFMHWYANKDNVEFSGWS